MDPFSSRPQARLVRSHLLPPTHQGSMRLPTNTKASPDTCRSRTERSHWLQQQCEREQHSRHSATSRLRCHRQSRRSCSIQEQRAVVVVVLGALPDRLGARPEVSMLAGTGQLAERMRNLVSTLLAVYAFVSARLGNTEPETETRTSPSDARRDKPPRSPRRSASTPAAPRPWTTLRDPRARNPLSQNAVRTPQNANAPAGRPGRSLLTVGRASFARAS